MGGICSFLYLDSRLRQSCQESLILSFLSFLCCASSRSYALHPLVPMLCIGMPKRRLCLPMIILRLCLKLCIPCQRQGTRKVVRNLSFSRSSRSSAVHPLVPMLCIGMPKRRLCLPMIILRLCLKLCIPCQRQGRRKVVRNLSFSRSSRSSAVHPLVPMLCIGMPKRRLCLPMIILRLCLKLCIPCQRQGTRNEKQDDFWKFDIGNFTLVLTLYATSRQKLPFLKIILSEPYCPHNWKYHFPPTH